MIPLELALVPSLVGFGTLVFWMVVRWIAIRTLPKVARGRRWAQVVIDSCRGPSLVWCFSAALAAAITFVALPEKVDARLNTVIQIAFVFSVTWALANAAVRLMYDFLRRAESPMADSTIVYGFTRALIFTVGLLVIFSELSIAITPILTAFGVAGLAVAMAFKDTLENLFSGLHLLLDKAIEVGDTVRLEGGQEGVVRDIGWRTTKMRLGTGDTLIIPNVKFAQGILVRKEKPLGNG